MIQTAEQLAASQGVAVACATLGVPRSSLYAARAAKPGYFLTDPGPIQIDVPAEGGVTVPPVGIAWAPAHVYLPLLRR